MIKESYYYYYYYYYERLLSLKYDTIFMGKVLALKYAAAYSRNQLLTKSTVLRWNSEFPVKFKALTSSSLSS